MAHYIKIRIRVLLAGMMLLSGLSSCMWERDLDEKRQPGDGNALVRFSVRVPGAVVPGTRAADIEGESKVSEIDILVFKPDGGEYVYTVQCTGDEITTDPENIGKKNFTATLREGKYDIAILANSREVIASADLDGKNKEDALAALTFKIPAGHKWVFDSSKFGYRLIPMWGDVGTITVGPDTQFTGDGAIPLIRALARADVRIDAAVTNFKLTSVKVWGVWLEGATVPAPTAWDASRNVVTAPTIPQDDYWTDMRVIFDNSGTKEEIDEAENSCIGKIYLLEYDKNRNSDTNEEMYKNSRAHIVIGGIYDSNDNGNFEDDGEQTYYRLDFSTGQGASQTFLDILRNHLYVFNVTKIMGVGFSDPDTAEYSDPVNIEADVVEVNDDMTEYVYDGQHVLSVNRKELSDNYSPRTYPVAVYTDAYNGWIIEKIVDAADGTTPVTWVTADPMVNTLSGTKKTVTLNVAENEIHSDRKAIIWFVAGRLRMPVTVEQTWTGLWGGGADILYYDASNGNRLSIGKWDLQGVDSEVTFDNMVFTQFGSLIGFAGSGAWDNTNSIRFNPTTTPSFAYDAIPNYGTDPTAWAGSIFDSPSVSDTERYHTFANIKAGRGDICKLAGLTGEQVRGAATMDDLNALLEARDPKYKGWRLPTVRENITILGSSPDYAFYRIWTLGYSLFYYTNGDPSTILLTRWRYYYDYDSFPTETRGTLARPATGRIPVVTHYFDVYSQIMPLPGERSITPPHDNTLQGNSAFYWSSNPIREDSGYKIAINNDELWGTSNGQTYILGGTIRCVRESR